MAESTKGRRERAAQARAAAESTEKRRERTIRIIGAVTVVAVVVGIVGVAWWASNSERQGQEFVLAEPDPSAPLPEGVRGADDEFAFAVSYGTADASAPTLEVWEDFQCPACGSLEQANGAGLAGLAESGRVQLLWRPSTFLDRNVGNDASTRAVAAWGCAIDAGRTREFHDELYANQPPQGVGWSDEELLAIGSTVGITGADFDTFSQCVTDRTYAPWAANSTQQFYEKNIQGTPSVFLNGQPVATEIVADPVAFEQTFSNLTE
jgi:protein-disulfide isomerase